MSDVQLQEFKRGEKFLALIFKFIFSVVNTLDSIFEVVGVNFLFWKWENSPQVSSKTINSLVEDISRKIGFEIRVLDYEKIFKDTIVNRFLSELSLGQTPNPCVKCNPLVKFKLLREFADKENIEFISTGHYARVEKNKEGTFKLMKGIDQKKDQSY